MRTVLVAYAGVGSGHATAAHALRDTIRAHGGSTVTVRVADALVGSPVDEAFRWADHQQILYRVTGGKPYDLLWRSTAWIPAEKKVAPILAIPFRRFRETLARMRPDLVIATHVLPALLTSAATRSGGPGPRLMCVPTDFTANAFWPTTGVDAYCVSHDAVANILASRRVPRERIHSTGIPLREQFARCDATRAAKARRGVSATPPTILLVAGALAGKRGLYGKVVARLASLVADVAAHPEFTLRIVTGADTRLLHHLKRTIADRRAENIRVIGFRENMAELMDAADILVTKPGGLITAEALAMRLPMILLGPNVAQERENEAFLTAIGAAISVTESQRVFESARAILRETAAREGMRAACERYGKPRAARDIAGHAIGLLDNEKTGRAREREAVSAGSLRAT